MPAGQSRSSLYKATLVVPSLKSTMEDAADSRDHMASSPQPYEYEPLPGPAYIRLLTISPAEPHSTALRCNIEVMRLTDKANYTALSYSWGMHSDGDDSESHHILIANRTKCVTRNLHDALWRIRSHDPSFRVWADALCIDQSDLGERSSQVSMMAEIYRNATRVLAWLGADYDQLQAEATYRMIACLSHGSGGEHDRIAHSWTLTEGTQVSLCDIWALGFTKDPAATWRQVQRFLPALSATASNLTDFSNRRYFTRRWVVQELHHGGAWIEYWFADQRVSMNQLVASLHCSALIGDAGLHVEHFLRDHKAPRAIGPWEKLAGVRDRFVAFRGSRHFPTLLVTCVDLECSDPRDRLYSLVSIDPSLSIVPDYTSSVEQISIAFATRLVEKRYIPFVLLNASGGQLPSEVLPSWVPDLQTKPVNTISRGYDFRNWKCTRHDATQEPWSVFGTTLISHLHLIGRVMLGTGTNESRSEFARPEKPESHDIGTLKSGKAWTRHQWSSNHERWAIEWPRGFSEDLYLFSLLPGDIMDMFLWLRPVSPEWKQWTLVSVRNPTPKGEMMERQAPFPKPMGPYKIHIV